MKPLTFITGNAGKAEQLGRYLSFSIDHAKLDIEEIQSLDLEEVATEKARAAYAILGTPVLVEDTALRFEALGRLPGTLVKWFFEEIGNEGIAKLLTGYKNRNAVAETCFALCDKNGIHLFKGSRKGTVSPSPRGSNGFGWNAVFIPEGESLTWAEMDNEQQSKTSMRRLAIEKLQVYLEANYK
ncbi:non-canonical purine NTP pyrophosphatase [Patescibacteria group bacterium]|nr:non-canonical purine NTP pyrophosphatase [Patescibacteria group bacterium]